MKYVAKKDTKFMMTRYERKVVKRLRRISILKNIPLRKWTAYEMEDLKNEYDLYSIFHKDENISLKQFLEDGIYEDISVYENLKSNSQEPVVVTPSNKRFRLKK